MDDRPNIFDLDRTQLCELVGQWGMPAYRADQLLKWVYQQSVDDVEEMSNIGREHRQVVAERLRLGSGRVVKDQEATDGTRKLLVRWDSGTGGETECVSIPAQKRRTACVSTQVGCAVGCKFCASGLEGLAGNLSSGQIVEQIWRLNQLDPAQRVTHVVFMGMGEPLANYAELVKAIRTIMAEWALHLSGRRLTVSTVGLPAQMRRLASEGLPVTLAISLHASNDRLRRELIPWAESVSIRQLIEAGRYYFDTTGREVTLEYLLLGGVNDRPEHATQLADVARQLRCNVNLIAYNPIEGLPFKQPADDTVARFQSLLQRAGVNTQLRASRGRDIAAACGQLRRQAAGANGVKA